MREFLNENTLFGTVSMFLDENDGLVLVVEGPDDELILGPHVANHLTIITATGGRQQVLAAAEAAIRKRVDRARFLIDRDYDLLRDPGWTVGENVVVSESHDVFMDIVIQDQSVLSRVLDVHMASARRDPNRKDPIPLIEDVIRDSLIAAMNIVTMRVLNERLDLGLEFGRVKIGGLSMQEIEVSSYAERLMLASGLKRDEIASFAPMIDEVHKELEGLGESHVGDHDFFAAIARRLKYSNIIVAQAVLEKAFVLSVRCSSLLRVGWLTSVRDWGSSHARVVFTCPAC